MYQVATEQIKLFLKSKQRPTRRTSHQAPLLNDRWEKPLLGWIKLNWDTSVDIGGKSVRMGVDARDQDGNVVTARCLMRFFISERDTAVALGAWFLIDLQTTSSHSYHPRG
jgi:hypothetical protein